MTRTLVLAAIACLGTTPVLAMIDIGQDASSQTTIQQMNPTVPGQANATGAAQVGSGETAPISTGPATPRDRTLGGSAPAPANPTPPAQVTSERGRTDAGVQLTTTTPTADATPSPTNRAQGRNTATSTPTGPDRCDPQAGRSLPVACDRVIEARANEFRTPDHQPLSAEQRLLATQRELRPMTTDVGSAARRRAHGQVDESNAALAVASIASQRPLQADEEEEATVDTTAVDAIVAGIVNLVTGAPPTP